MWRAAAVVILLTGCAAPAPAPVGVGLYQTRTDTPLDKIEIQVTNTGDAPLTVERAALRSQRLAGEVVWDEAVEIPAGAAMDLKVDLPPPRCDGAAGEQVDLTVDGRSQTVPAADTLGQLAEYVRQACFAQQVAGTAQIAVVDVTRSGMRVRVDPGQARVGRLGTTILFAPEDPQALAASPGDAASVRAVALRPNRCDAHALGEDKQGTYFEVRVTVPDGRSGRYRFGVDPQQRAALYRLYARQCGLS